MEPADRAILAIVAPALSADLSINPLQIGLVFSAFGWACVAAQGPGGWLLDRCVPGWAFGHKHPYLVR